MPQDKQTNRQTDRQTDKQSSAEATHAVRRDCYIIYLCEKWLSIACRAHRSSNTDTLKNEIKKHTMIYRWRMIASSCIQHVDRSTLCIEGRLRAVKIV